MIFLLSRNFLISLEKKRQRTKNRIVKTNNYEQRLLYSYETSSPYFGDIGIGYTDQNGQCYISIDDIFSETICIQCEYQVFLQQQGNGKVWVEEKKKNYFIVKGTPNLKFSWEIKALQKDYQILRIQKDDLLEYSDFITKNLEKEYMKDLNEYIM